MEKVDDLDRLLHAIIEECKIMLRCEAASLALYDDERNDLVFTMASGGSEEEITRWRVKMGRGIVGLVAERRKALYSNDPKTDKRWFGKVDDSSGGFITHNVAAVPMIQSDHLVGVVEALNRPDENFGDDDLGRLQILADQTAMALEIHRLIKAKQESERLATFAVALADIGHSAKNMLMRLEFPVTLIDQSLAKGDVEGAREMWEIMKQGTTEIGQLVRDMLEYSRPRTPDLSQVEIARLVSTVVSDCRPDAESKNIALSATGIDAPLPWILDEKILHSSMHNLVGNAVEAMAEHGGSIVTVEVSTSTDPDELQIAVADDGPGIPVEIQRRVFDPFFSTKSKGGTGLGLASVKKGIEEHGGRVLLVSEEGKGACFSLTFPVGTIHREEA